MNDTTKYLSARFHAAVLSEHVTVHYWMQSRDLGDACSYHLSEAHTAFAQIAEVMGYEVKRIPDDDALSEARECFDNSEDHMDAERDAAAEILATSRDTADMNTAALWRQTRKEM